MFEEGPSLLNTADISRKINGESDAFLNTEMESSLLGNAEEYSPEELQLNELREARIRAAQMEKTMRWWSDCTANWRDKWGNVKTERNKAREEVKTLKQKLESANQEIYKLKRERNEFSEGNTKLRKDVEKMEAELRRDRRAFVLPLRVVDGSSAGGEINAAPTVATKPESLKREEHKSLEKVFKDTVSTPAVAEEKLNDTWADGKDETQLNDKNEHQLLQPLSLPKEDVVLNDKEETKDKRQLVLAVEQELSILEDKLENTEKKVLEEKRLKASLSETIEELKAEIDHLKGTIQQETIVKEKAINELNRLREEKERRRSKINSDASGSYSKDTVDSKLKELRAEIEKLQKDNATEWSKREKLETEKLTAERENKKLKHEIADLENEMHTKVNETSQAVSFDLKQIQSELEEKKKELADLKVAHTKLKRIYQDKKEDVLHSKTRVDHHEEEIKKLRTRIDELKQKLTSTEDEVDQKENLARKLQRSLDEQSQQCQVLRVQMEHLQSRWKQMTLMARAPRRGETNNSSAEEDNFLELDDY